MRLRTLELTPVFQPQTLPLRVETLSRSWWGSISSRFSFALFVILTPKLTKSWWRTDLNSTPCKVFGGGLLFKRGEVLRLRLKCWPQNSCGHFDSKHSPESLATGFQDFPLSFFLVVREKLAQILRNKAGPNRHSAALEPALTNSERKKTDQTSAFSCADGLWT